MKIYLMGSSRSFLEGIKKALIEAGMEDIYIFASSDISPEEIAKNAPDCEILVASPSGFRNLSKEHMENMPDLKMITTVSVGTDWIDIESAKNLNIVISNEKGVNSEAVAEHCFGMILDLSKRITEADRGIRERGEFRASLYEGVELYRKTLGIIGLGDIGQRVARIAGGFSMRIMGVNESGRKVSRIDVVDIKTLLKESDVIAVTVPLTDETENLLSSREFSIMKDEAILVSISREKIIDKKAVLKAIDTNKISGFAFDAEIAVAISKNDSYLKYKNIIITPHTASVTKEANKGYVDMTVENIKAFLNKHPIRVVN